MRLLMVLHMNSQSHKKKCIFWRRSVKIKFKSQVNPKTGKRSTNRESLFDEVRDSLVDYKKFDEIDIWRNSCNNTCLGVVKQPVAQGWW